MGINDALETLGIHNSQMLLTKCLGLSLSDHYWVRPVGNDMTWKSVNFFDNDFSDDIGDVLFGTTVKSISFDYSSPDNTSDGNLQKRWKIIDGKRCLFKSGSKPYRQQPFNEVIASAILDKLGIDHIPYTLMWIADKPYSACENFVTKHTELISAARLLQIRPKENNENEYLHVVNICKELGIDIVPMLDRMIVFDYIIANEDRHFGNFGFLVDSHSNQIIAPAPLFDHGNSLLNFAGAQALSSEEALVKYAGTLLPCVYDSFIDEAKNVMTHEHRMRLRSLLEFRFGRHTKYNLPKERITMLEEVVHSQIQKLLD
jgi:hypothetical protein